MATKEDLIHYLTIRAQRESEDLSEPERQLRRKNLLEFLQYLKEQAWSDPPT